ncbi:three-helix bundle dimerization domain-containing protein [Mycobacteroides franklinii]|uniref:Uncharacterized protein n=1 Tax=Mycobacteroides franklinii TaxID=948102 RepID=A0A4R5P9K0_9MYCO|nr:hypothetical protein BST24_14815 [Mycobacteroides franklinii]TDH20575.1 hypothetical protein EJ571_17575 [Mycobacteroides franklinii]
MSGISEQTSLAAVQQRLASKYSWLSPEHIASVVQCVYARFAECRVREFVPLLVERRSCAELATVSA